MKITGIIKNLWAPTVFCLVLAPVWATANTQPDMTKQMSIEEIKPPDVLVHVGRVRAELSLLRHTMGKPWNRQHEITISNADPREVFYQALTMFRKANRMSFEQTRTIHEEPETPEGEIIPGHVFGVVDDTLQLIRNIKSKLGIVERIAEPTRDPRMQPADVFQSIVQANRQLNLLLEQRFAPKDVYQRVSYAISYTDELLGHLKSTSRLSDSEALLDGIMPSDVFQRLVKAFNRIRVIGEQSGLAMLELDTTRMNTADVVPSDVYDVASLVVSELAYLHAQIDQIDLPRTTHDPGRKYPAHVYQRVGILMSQLDELSAIVATKPNWLGKR